MRCAVKKKKKQCYEYIYDNILVNHRQITFSQECYWGLNLPGEEKI